MAPVWEVYIVETNKTYDFYNTERGAKVATTRQNKISDYYRNQGIYKDLPTYAYRQKKVGMDA